MVWFVNWFLQVNIGLSINCVYPKWKTLLATDLYQLRFHTLLQGAYKYMLCQFMDSRNTFGKKILAKISAFLHVVFQIEYVTTYVILCKKAFQSMDANGIVHCSMLFIKLWNSPGTFSLKYMYKCTKIYIVGISVIFSKLSIISPCLSIVSRTLDPYAMS